MKRITLLKIFSYTALFTLLSACGAGTTYEASVSYTYDDNEPLEPVRLNRFDVLDTYGADTGQSPLVEPSISPYVNLGYFDIYWDVAASEDYVVDIRINSTPSTDGSQLVATEYCSPYGFCHDFQSVSCEYTPDFYLACEFPSGESAISDISPWIYDLPESLYLIVEVCDIDFIYCEYDTKRVWFE